MNQLEAFRETARRYLEWWEDRASAHDFDRVICFPESVSPEHVRMMCSTVEDAFDPRTPSKPFSPPKLGRWLGWLQASATVARALTLEDCKEINRRWSDDDEPPAITDLGEPLTRA